MAGSSRPWAPGDHLTHRFNPELGVGRITGVEARALVVEFPRTGATLRLARHTDALIPIDLSPGRPVRTIDTREETSVAARLPDGTLRLANGRIVPSHALWPLELEGALLERLVLGDLDDPRDFFIRLDILRLLSLREASGLGSFLGGRIRLFPHQLYVAERATATDPVRWLLADEVGLGKTIEAALILNRLLHMGKVDRCLVVVPEALTVQWLGELWRKYHRIFTLLDTPRLADVERDFGQGFNPFDVHRRSVIALETLVERPALTEQAVAAGIDLLVIDEAQRLRRPPSHPGEPAWRAVAPIAALGRHVLLLSATPLEDDAHGFFRLLQLLRPEEFPEDASFEERLARGVPLPPCTSSTRRVDIGGLPPRVGIPVDLESRSTRVGEELEEVLRGAGVGGGGVGGAEVRGAEVRDAEVRGAGAWSPVARRKKVERIRRALSSGAALRAVLAGDADDRELHQKAEAADASDPRLEWLLSRGRRWRESGDKTLVFVEHRETLEALRAALGQRGQLASGTFHEDLPASRRDLEVARFREPSGPSILVSTECGGEGRNFEFCRRLVLFDLPWKPTVVEQRIGRLDRIGRRIPVDVVYFRPARGIGRDVVRLFEALGVFREPLAGLEPQLAHIESAIEAIAVEPLASLPDEELETLVSDAHAARSRIREAAYQQLHRDPYRTEMADEILARVPRELDALNEQVVVAACTRLGLTVERPRGHRTWAIEMGSDSLVDSLAGVPSGASYVGSFDREEAVQDETLDFFASGHPLVEGVFAHFEDNRLGRVVQLEVDLGPERGEGVIAVYKDGPQFEVVALDSAGRARPEWAAAFRDQTLRARALRTNDDPEGWKTMIREVGGRLAADRRPHAIAAVRGVRL